MFCVTRCRIRGQSHGVQVSFTIICSSPFEKKKKDCDVFFWGGDFWHLLANSRHPWCVFFCVTLHKLLMSWGLVWNKYVCVSTGSALLSDIALGHSSISLSLSLCLSVCLKGGGGVGEVYIELQTADSPWNLYCAKSTIWGHPITYLTLLWHSTQLLYELSKDSYWEQNEVGIGQCRGVCLYLRQCTADAVHQNKTKNGTSRCQLISLPDPHRAQKLISTLVAIQVISLHLFLSLGVSGLMQKEISQRAEAAQTMRDTQPPLI